jgi:hypothetical protein
MAKTSARERSIRFPAKITPSRRSFLLGGLGLAAGSTLPLLPQNAIAKTRPVVSPRRSDALIADVQERTFRFFWDTTDPLTGLACDRYPSASPASIAAVGFALTAYPIGVERGFVTRKQAIARVLNTLRFLVRAPQGPAATGTAGYRGFFYHYLDPVTGVRSGQSELSTVDTALLLGGVLFCQAYFDRTRAEEAEIRKRAETIYSRVDWQWAQTRPPAISHGWSPESGFLQFDWRGYNEAMIVYLLALGSPTHPVDPNAWNAWTSTYDQSWSSEFGLPHLAFAPLFGHQYCQTWVDFRGLQDSYLRSRGIDYFENNRRAVYAQRAYAIANPHGWKDYGIDVWGVTASDGPANVTCEYEGKPRAFRAYAARGAAGPQSYDDGTLAPTALLASIAVAPEIVLPAVHEITRRFGTHIYANYGFLDAFNPSFDFNVPLAHGRCIPGFGWVASDYLGIDQGPIVGMIENHRSELVWQTMRKSAHLRRGLTRAGFTGGWLGDAA